MTTTGAGYTNSPGSACNPSGSAALVANEWAHYTVDGTTNTGDNGKNQLTGTPAGIWQYDSAGNVLYDGTNYYAYDGAGRLCAVQGSAGTFGYIYDAEGDRVAKGSITASPNPLTQPLSCNPANNGFTLTQSYIYVGDQFTTLDGSGNWIRTDVSTGGALIATYDPAGSYDQHYHVSDALGTRRLQTDPWGWPEGACASGPFGDNLNCSTLANAPPSADAATPKSAASFEVAKSRSHHPQTERRLGPRSLRMTPVNDGMDLRLTTLELVSYIAMWPRTGA